MRVADPCGCFPTGRHYPGIAHLLKVRVVGVAEEVSPDADWIEETIAFIDTETTGREAERDRIVEIGVVIGQGGRILRSKSWLVHPEMLISAESTAIHGITDAQVANERPFREIVAEIVEFVGGAIPAAYNAAFDKAFVLAELGRMATVPSNLPPVLRREIAWLDPLVFARELYKEEQSRALGDMAERLGIKLDRAHRATDDATAALLVLYALAKDIRVPKTYAALIQEQRRLGRLQDEARRFWKK